MRLNDSGTKTESHSCSAEDFRSPKQVAKIVSWVMCGGDVWLGQKEIRSERQDIRCGELSLKLGHILSAHITYLTGEPRTQASRALLLRLY
jgi:hypothetical protein